MSAIPTGEQLGQDGVEYGEEAPQVIFRLRSNISYMWMISQPTSSSHKLCNPLMYYISLSLSSQLPRRLTLNGGQWELTEEEEEGGSPAAASQMSHRMMGECEEQSNYIFETMKLGCENSLFLCKYNLCK